jgi:hypothetical protein
MVIYGERIGVLYLEFGIEDLVEILLGQLVVLAIESCNADESCASLFDLLLLHHPSWTLVGEAEQRLQCG